MNLKPKWDMFSQTITALWSKVPGVFKRPRTRWIAGGSIAVLLYNIFSNPTGLYTTGALLGHMALPIIAVWSAYFVRKTLLDYVNLEDIYLRAKESPIGAGLVFVGVCIIFYGLLALFGTNLQIAQAQPIPAQAQQYMPMLKAETERVWVNHPKPFILQG